MISTKSSMSQLECISIYIIYNVTHAVRVTTVKCRTRVINVSRRLQNLNTILSPTRPVEPTDLPYYSSHSNRLQKLKVKTKIFLQKTWGRENTKMRGNGTCLTPNSYPLPYITVALTPTGTENGRETRPRRQRCSGHPR